MDNQAIINQLKDIIAEKLDVNIKREEIAADISLFEDGVGLDSIAIMEFITVIEETFGFQFADDDLNGEIFQSLDTLAPVVMARSVMVNSG